MARNLKEQQELEKLTKQLTEAVYAGKIMSLAYLLIDSDGQVQLSYHVTENQALIMMGLTKLLDVNIATLTIKTTKPKDYME